MATPAQSKPQVKELDANAKSALLLAVSQLDMLVSAFGNNAPERVQKAAKEFQSSLKEWAGIE